MNQKTAKLLKKWAGVAGQNAKGIKKWWYSLNRHERAAERRQIKAKLAEEE